jgi:NodT family efflux transporter outer membrane factor (OMF) lipoprotein
VLAACAVGPDFHRPPLPAVARYTREGVGKTAAADGVAQVVRPGARLAASWWQLFHSRALDCLVVEALARNPSLDAARANLRRSHYALEAGYGVFFPQLDLQAGASRERFSASQFGLSMPPTEFNLYTARGTLGYTIDLFGGQRRNVEALRAQVDAQGYALVAAKLAVTGNVVDTAIARAGYRAEIAATEQLIASLRQQVEIADTQARAGTAPYANVLSFRGQLASTAATLPPLRARLAQADDLLATLVGRAPADWRAPELELSDLALPADLPVSLPSQLVRQRPDILIAEATLHASSANIGVATAAMFPSITLSANDGFSSNALGALFTPAGWLWSIGANLAAPVFHGGTLNAQRKAAIEAYRQSLANYGQTVLAALADVANSLWALQLDADAVAEQGRAVDAWAQARQLVQINYASGVADYLQVLVTEDSYLQARLGYIQAQTQRLQDTVALFVAVGGGWTDYPARGTVK